MDKKTIFGILVLCSGVGYAQEPKFRTPAGMQLVPDSYIVVFRDDIRGSFAVAQTASALSAMHGSRVDRTYRHAINGAAMTMSESEARLLARDPRVRYVEQDAMSYVVADQPNPPAWGIDRVDERQLPLDNNYHWDFDGSGVNIYIIDTGIRTTHNDFNGRASWGTACIGSQIDDHGHGTHVAGTAASSSYGVAKNANLIAVKVCDALGQCPNSAVLCGIDFVTQQKQANPGIPMVANMSLGGGFSQAENDAVNDSVSAGVFYAVAAGNDNGSNACFFSPASAAGAFTVASSTISDARSSFSNTGTCVDIFAPGSSILSTWNTSNSATALLSGTSMATPHVAGAAALLLHEDPTSAPAQVAADLETRATSGVIANAGSGTPNRLLFTLDDAIPPPPAPECSSDALDLMTFNYTGAAGQNFSNNFAVQDNGNEIRLADNTWVRTTTPFELNSNTQLEFYFRSSAQGEIHAAGFDEDDSINNDPRYFMFWGTQNWTGNGKIEHQPRYSGSGDWELFTLDVGAQYTGSKFLAFVNDNDAGFGNEGIFRCVRVINEGPSQCTVQDDFESGPGDWFNDTVSTCATGSYVIGNPTRQTNSGVVTQVGGSHSGVNSIFTAQNSSAGVNDVDRGNCVLGSPVWQVASDSVLSLWYFHGQRDTGDDANDFFRIEYSTNAGANWSTLVANGDARSSASWRRASANIPAGSNARVRVQCSDGSGPGDLVECGIDDLEICSQ